MNKLHKQVFTSSWFKGQTCFVFILSNCFLNSWFKGVWSENKQNQQVHAEVSVVGNFGVSNGLHLACSRLPDTVLPRIIAVPRLIASLNLNELISMYFGRKLQIEPRNAINGRVGDLACDKTLHCEELSFREGGPLKRKDKVLTFSQAQPLVNKTKDLWVTVRLTVWWKFILFKLLNARFGCHLSCINVSKRANFSGSISRGFGLPYPHQ